MKITDKTAPRAGWHVDGDWWHWRKIKASDPFKHSDFDNSCHCFIENGKLYCRDAEQAEILDGGKIPPN